MLVIRTYIIIVIITIIIIIIIIIKHILVFLTLRVNVLLVYKSEKGM